MFLKSYQVKWSPVTAWGDVEPLVPYQKGRDSGRTHSFIEWGPTNVDVGIQTLLSKVPHMF